VGAKGLTTIEARLSKLRPAPGVQALVRVSQEVVSGVSVRNGRQEPLSLSSSRGAMVTVYHQGACAYAATADLSEQGLAKALDRATELAAKLIGKQGATGLMPRFVPSVQVEPGPKLMDQDSSSSGQALECLLVEDAQVSALANSSDKLVERQGSIQFTRATRCLFLLDALRLGVVTPIAAEAHNYCVPHYQVTVMVDGVSQTRTLAGAYNGFCQQGTWDVVQRSGLIGAGQRLAREAFSLARAGQCPSGEMDLLLAPDQMLLQIHESIGHPLELDRILGDERNFAGGSFVTPEMFGNYMYGSAKLNVTVGPQIEHEFASFTHDDEGLHAEPVRIIEKGKLMRPLGGDRSSQRAQAAGFALAPVACSRASSWDRPSIDRMPNLNVEPGTDSLAQMIASCKQGVLMRTNVSWSIDDRRDKFQFGCEYAQLIENGELTRVVRNPNYRGRSANFWRNLDGVGDASTVEVMGTPFCGKGEPGQVIRVGHASPACLFRAVQVLGGEQ
jgi:predicted Zn-dependent protease